MIINAKCVVSRRHRVLHAARIFARTSREEISLKWRPKLPLRVKYTLAFFYQFLFLIYVKVSLSTSLKVAMKVRIIQVIRMSAIVFFRTNPVEKTR